MKGKGKVIRPCHACMMPVKFVFWKMRGQQRIFHWANPDDSHHIHHSGFAKRESYADDYPAEQVNHMRDILGR